MADVVEKSRQVSSSRAKRLGVIALAFVVAMAVVPLKIARAADYNINYAKSSVTFGGTASGRAFKGTFERWQGTISFDPDNLAASTLKARFDLGSGKTGDRSYDGTIPKKDWLNVSVFPQATFNSTRISRTQGGYRAEGTFTLRGVSKPLAFDFKISGLGSGTATARASFAVDRIDFGIGTSTDPTAKWVSRDIDITLKIVAQRR